MTTIDVAGPARGTLAAALRDAWIVAQRNLRAYKRQPQVLIFLLIQPIMFILLFSYVFGGAIDAPGTTYRSYLVPGIIAQSVTFNTAGTSIAVAEDLSKGIMDRFRSLPMSSSAVLAGRVVSDAIVSVVTVLLMGVVGYLVGFRIQNGVLPALGALVLLVAFGFTFSWIAAVIGLAVREPEAAQSAGFMWLFPLNFVSSVFVPIETMPGWMQAFADINPITLTVDATRALLLGPEWATFAGVDLGRSLLGAIAWMAAVLVVFVPLASRGWKRLS